MPTGYTAAVASGEITDLKAFALQCARGMGALIMMRDEPWDAPIPERFEPSSYHAEKLAELRAERERLFAMTEAEADQKAREEFADKTAAKEAWLAERTEQRNRYNAMLAKVIQWQGAPEGLKSFMLEQLHSGRDFDCGGSDAYYDEPALLSGAEWRDQRLAKVDRDLSYYAAEDAKERERTESRNLWIAQLHHALASVDRSGEAGETRSGSTEGESAVPAQQGDAHNPQSPPETKDHE